MTNNPIDNNGSFFTVWREDTGAVKKKHPLRAEAITEAERLAEQNPGKKFYIMRAVGHVVGKIELEILLEKTDV